MRVRGTESKKIVFDKLLATFDGAFMVSDKELRIPLVEDGAPIEIKVALTRAKDLLGRAAPTNKGNQSGFISFDDAPDNKISSTLAAYDIAPTEEEKRNVEQLLAMLDF